MNSAKIIIGDSRKMIEIEDKSIDLILTSPPYWHIKDYGSKKQIGFGQSLHEYLKDMYRVWRECYRVLKEGRRFCINIGDQFARSSIYGRYKIIPLHAEFILQCEKIGFDYMGSIIWQKKTTMNTTGGANVMGSYPYPPNGMVEIDYEYILIFKKPGKSKKIEKEIKENSKLTKEEWKEYFYGHWNFNGAKQINHQAMFPQELPKRLIKMFSFVNETVLDPFMGSGTTAKAALELERNVIGYEINEDFLSIMQEKIKKTLFNQNLEIIKREKNICFENTDYEPIIQDAKPKKIDIKKETLYKVIDIIDENTIKLNNGEIVKFLGIEIVKKEETLKYLKENLLKKEVFLKYDNYKNYAYVYLKNKIFINAYLIKSSLAKTDIKKEFKHKRKFLEFEV